MMRPSVATYATSMPTAAVNTLRYAMFIITIIVTTTVRTMKEQRLVLALGPTPAYPRLHSQAPS